MSIPTYTTLGRTGLRISRLALGTMTFGTEWGWGSDKAGAQRLFSAYLEAGGNFIDTADLYTNGTSESWLGEFIKAIEARDRIVLTTKFSFNAQPGNPNAGGNGRKNILRAVEGSLRRLQTDHLDLYLLHNWDQVTPVEEVLRTFDELVRAGKVRHVGLSNVPAWYAARAATIAELRGYEPIAALQLEYSLAERGIESEFVRLGTELGAGIMAWSPLASGLLTGKYRPGAAGTGRLETMKDTTNPAFKKFNERNWRIVAALDQAAKDVGRSMAQIAIAWVAQRPGVASVILGASKPEQLTETMQALDVALPADILARLDAAGAQEPSYPYLMFGQEMQGMLTGGTRLLAKPSGYMPTIDIQGAGAGAGAK